MPQARADQDSLPGPRHVRLTAAAGQLVLRLLDDGAEVERVSLPLSWEVVRERFVRHDIPTEAEVEHAINFIEDELMRRPTLRNREHLALSSADPVLNAVLNKAGEDTITRSRDDVEALFTRYARISMGRSPVYDDIDVRADEFVALLVIREILHHLDYEAITILGERGPTRG